MPTTITRSIGSAGGRDYATIALWLAAIPSSLVTADEVWVGELYNDSEFSATTGNSATKTGDATRYLHLKCASGQSFRDHADKLTNPLKYDQSKGVGFASATGYLSGGTLLSITSNYAKIEGIQFKCTGNGNTTNVLSGTGAEIRHCISQNACTNSILNACVNVGGGAKAINCVAVHTASGACSGFRTASAAQVLNCTAVQYDSVGGSNNGIRYDKYSATQLVKNTAVFGFATFIQDTTAKPTFTTCATDVAGSETGVTHGLTYANQFEGVGSGAPDFRLKSGNSLANAGTDLADPTDDIVGTTRSTNWDIGAWEAATAPTGQPIAKRHGGVPGLTQRSPFGGAVWKAA